MNAFSASKPLVTTQPIPYLHQTSFVLRRSSLELLSVTWNLAAELLTFNVPETKMPSTNVFKESYVKITLLKSIPKRF